MLNAKQTMPTGRPKRGNDRKVLEVVQRVSATIGNEFFDSIVKNLGQALGADCVYLGEFAGGMNERVRTLSSFSNGGPVCCDDYELAGTVAAQVITGDPWSCTRGAAKRYPDDKLLLAMGAQACIAVPLLNSRRQAVGVLLVAFRRALANMRMSKALLEMLAPRASAELQRRQADSALQESEQRYKAFIS